MNKASRIYFSLLGLLLVGQLCLTAFNLSQNIGYGQKIALLEQRKQNLLAEQSRLESQLAGQLAMQRLSSHDDDSLRPITQVISVQSSYNSLASR